MLTLTRGGVTHDVIANFGERFGKAYTAQIEHFTDCLLHDKSPIVTPAAARAALQIGIAATRAQHQERVVYVRDVTA